MCAGTLAVSMVTRERSGERAEVRSLSGVTGSSFTQVSTRELTSSAYPLSLQEKALTVGPSSTGPCRESYTEKGRVNVWYCHSLPEVLGLVDVGPHMHVI